MCFEVVDGKFEYSLQLQQFKLAAPKFRRVQGRLIVIAQQMFAVAATARDCRRQKVLRENHPRSKTRAVGTMAAFSNPVEAIAGSDHPCVGRRALKILSKVFEYRGVFRRQRGEVVDRLIDTGGQACGRHIVTQNSAIHDLGEKGRLRDEFAHQVWDVLLTFRSERLLVPGAATKGDDDYLSLFDKAIGECA